MLDHKSYGLAVLKSDFSRRYASNLEEIAHLEAMASQTQDLDLKAMFDRSILHQRRLLKGRLQAEQVMAEAAGKIALPVAGFFAGCGAWLTTPTRAVLPHEWVSMIEFALYFVAALSWFMLQTYSVFKHKACAKDLALLGKID
jgi:hypothetical protein